MNDNHPVTPPRRLDHCVLPTAKLDVARARLSALGFTVAPQGNHPFGTINACVYIAGDTFLEPLAIGDRGAVEAAIGQGNVFLARDRTFRESFGEEGFSALVVSAKDAQSDHARFVAQGVSAGAPLDFSRPFEDGAGRSDEASFRLAFAAKPGDMSAFFFACERANVPAVDRSALERHANGVAAIARIVAVADDPSSYRMLLGELTLATVGEGEDNGIHLQTANGMVSVLTPMAARAMLKTDIQASGKPALTAIVFEISSLPDMTALLDANGVEFVGQNDGIVVRPAPGQGAFLVFQEAS